MVTAQVVWHGTKDEADDLLRALGRNCTCEYETETGMKTSTCPGHEMMVGDQRAVDWLLFCRRNVVCLRREEGIA